MQAGAEEWRLRTILEGSKSGRVRVNFGIKQQLHDVRSVLGSSGAELEEQTLKVKTSFSADLTLCFAQHNARLDESSSLEAEGQEFGDQLLHIAAVLCRLKDDCDVHQGVLQVLVRVRLEKCLQQSQHSEVPAVLASQSDQLESHQLARVSLVEDHLCNAHVRQEGPNPLLVALLNALAQRRREHSVLHAPLQKCHALFVFLLVVDVLSERACLPRDQIKAAL
mmetsp:Transcript_20304/g.51456  ORF Transcript_20304/g.51456 Transcript_20304/m.51456 type:complete len:223 (-) Transcript_20304:501-1169(-)